MTSNSRKSDSKRKQTISGREPESLSRLDVSCASELSKVQRSTECRLPLSLHGDVITESNLPKLSLHYSAINSIYTVKTLC